MNEFLTGHLKVGERPDAAASEPEDLTRLLAATADSSETTTDFSWPTSSLAVQPAVQEAAALAAMHELQNTAGLQLQLDAAARPSIPPAVASVMVEDDLLSELIQSLSVADAASIRVTVPARASRTMQEPPTDPSITTTPITTGDVRPTPLAEAPLRKQQAFSDGEATTEQIRVAGIVDSEAGDKFPTTSSLLKRQGSIARLFTTSGSGPRRAKVNASAGRMTELLHSLESSAKPADRSDPEPPAETLAEPMRQMTQASEERLHGAPENPVPVEAEASPPVAPSLLASRYVPMLLLAIVALLVANLVAMLFLAKR